MRFLIAFIFTLSLFACLTAKTKNIDVTDGGFAPGNVSDVGAGDTIKWTNMDQYGGAHGVRETYNVFNGALPSYNSTFIWVIPSTTTMSYQYTDPNNGAAGTGVINLISTEVKPNVIKVTFSAIKALFK